MLYDLPEIELKCSLKYIFEGEVSYINHSAANLYKRQIKGVQIPHPLALYRIISSIYVS